jgi:hypothetical protein
MDKKRKGRGSVTNEPFSEMIANKSNANWKAKTNNNIQTLSPEQIFILFSNQIRTGYIFANRTNGHTLKSESLHFVM